MKNILLLVVFSLFSMFLFAESKDEKAIRSLLQNQVEGWNKGSLDDYMIGYWPSDSLVFIGKNGPTYGYQKTLERYKKSYQDTLAMGKLKSTVVSLQFLSKDYCFVVGKWELTRQMGNLNGVYTLLLRKIKGNWYIINDHSS